MKINIGCGRDYKYGWWNCDISREVKADAHLDIRKDDLPFNDNSAELIYISGVLEQIVENEHLIHALNECHRVLQDDAMMKIIVPNARFAIAHQDPFDVRKFTKETFQYFLKGVKQYTLYGSVYGFECWSKVSIEENERHILTVIMTK